jgi:hypothetical protein
MRLKASTEGLKIIKSAREGWSDAQWCREASKIIDPSSDWEKEDYIADEIFASGCSIPTLKNFLTGKLINHYIFQAFCQARSIHWQEIVDSESNIRIQEQNQRTSFIENFWVGRKSLIAQLTIKLQDNCRILTLVGITGIGKTALAHQLVDAMKTQGFQCERSINFDDDISQDFISVANNLLINWGETVTVDDRKEPNKLVTRLVRELEENRYLVQIDSLEMLLGGDEDTGWNNFRDEWWVVFFRKLMELPTCQSRFIITSQDFPNEFQELKNADLRPYYQLGGLDKQEQLELFMKTGITVEATSPNKIYLERIGAAYEGHPLALLVIAGEIWSEEFSGDVEIYWEKYKNEIDEITKTQSQKDIVSKNDRFKLDRFTKRLKDLVKKKIEASFKRLHHDFYDAYVLLCISSTYRRSVPKEAWFHGLKQHLKYEDNRLLIALDVLCDRYLIMAEEIFNGKELFRQHNLIRSVALAHSRELKVRIKK